MIWLKDISMTYPAPGGGVRALDGIDLHILPGEFAAVMGRSGSGKSTLLNILGTLLVPTSGSYVLNGMPVAGLPEKKICGLRRREIGFVFQKYQLLGDYTVWENICMPCFLDHEKPDREYLQELARQCGIEDKLDQYPDQLSGGQQQRAAIIRAMSHKPSVLLADEPTGNLDYQTGQDVMRILSSCRREFRQTVVMVTHDNECASYADRVIFLQDGKIRSI